MLYTEKAMVPVISLLMFIFAMLGITIVGGGQCEAAKCMFKKINIIIIKILKIKHLYTIQFW